VSIAENGKVDPLHQQTKHSVGKAKIDRWSEPYLQEVIHIAKAAGVFECKVRKSQCHRPFEGDSHRKNSKKAQAKGQPPDPARPSRCWDSLTRTSFQSFPHLRSRSHRRFRFTVFASYHTEFKTGAGSVCTYRTTCLAQLTIDRGSRRGAAAVIGSRIKAAFLRIISLLRRTIEL